MKDANFSPAYCALYPGMARIARKHGYALAIHGTLARDFDLVCVPWAETVSEPQQLIDELTTVFAIRLIGKGDKRNHGRIAYTLSVAFGECAVDLSFVNDMAVRKTPQDSLQNGAA